VLLIGMDTPQISGALLDADWEDCDAVLGLSEDGGFWGIGLRTSDAAPVFAGIEMSNPRTGSAQLARLLSLGQSVKLLPPLRDIDEPEDAAYVAERYPGLEFSRRHAALTRIPRPDVIFDHLYTGSHVRTDAPGARVLPLEARRWSGRADDVDQLVVSRCRGPVLDLGCGPGRMIQALNEAGVPALGVDISTMAVQEARSRGALAIHSSLADRLPAEGRWGTVLLMDGNIGIDGDVAALLHRCRTLLTPGGSIIVEVDSRPTWHQTRRVRLTADPAGYSAELTWTRTGTEAVRRSAALLDLLVLEEWTANSRAFLSLQSAT
jgi:SAM-dependent methyltransferase